MLGWRDSLAILPFLWPCHKQWPLPLPWLQQHPWVPPTPHRDPRGWGMWGRCVPHRSQPAEPPRDLWPLLWWGVGTGSQSPQEMGSPHCHGPAAVRRGWLGKSTPTLAGVIPAQERCQRQIPLLAPLFRQREGRQEPGSGPGFRLEAPGPFQGCEMFLSFQGGQATLLLQHPLQGLSHCCWHLLGIPGETAGHSGE